MGGIYLSHLKHLVVSPALAAVGLGGVVEDALVTGTFLAESLVGSDQWLQQGGGPALGIGQMEPATANDIFERWLGLTAQQHLRVQVLDLLPESFDVTERLVTDLRFAAIMTRLRYRMAPQALPTLSSAALAAFHKAVYNTSGGAADAQRNAPLFALAIAA